MWKHTDAQRHKAENDTRYTNGSGSAKCGLQAFTWDSTTNLEAAAVQWASKTSVRCNFSMFHSQAGNGSGVTSSIQALHFGQKFFLDTSYFWWQLVEFFQDFLFLFEHTCNILPQTVVCSIHSQIIWAGKYFQQKNTFSGI